MCIWELTPFLEWHNICHGCAPDSYCAEPGWENSLQSFGRKESTPCRVFPKPSSSSSAGAHAAAANLNLKAGQAILWLPKGPGAAGTAAFGLQLKTPWRTFSQSQLGWFLTFISVQGGPAAPVVTPTLTPEEEKNAYRVKLLLPEAKGPTEYTVLVSDHYWWARLETAEWIVQLLKSPPK